MTAKTMQPFEQVQVNCYYVNLYFILLFYDTSLYIKIFYASVTLLIFVFKGHRNVQPKTREFVIITAATSRPLLCDRRVAAP